LADQKVMKAANKGYGYTRQMLAAGRQKKNSSSKWISTRGPILSDTQGLTQLRPASPLGGQACVPLEIDLLTDMSGHAEGTSLDIMAHRPAPEQVSYMIFSGTRDFKSQNHLISDLRINPYGREQHYGQKILKLRRGSLPRNNSLVLSPETPKRSHDGLPEEGVVFCSFNHHYKISPPLFKVGMDLLKEVPGSVLWLMKLNKDAHTNPTQSARDQGVDLEHIIFASRLQRVEDHLARSRVADVLIDTSPCNGHTTAVDEQRSSQPVVSQCGGTIASRVAASLLHDMGMPELACYSYQEYHNKALQMATDKPFRTNYKEQFSMQMNERVGPPTPATQPTKLRQKLINLFKV
jgi:predicted O-linked N-acetylglucosamine transferase (SPINDLY family)